MEHQNIKQDTGKKKKDRWIVAAVLIFYFGLTALILIPGYLRSSAQAKYTLCQLNCKKIGDALKIYAGDNDGHYPERLEMLTPKYLKIIPTCRSSRTNRGYIRSYRISLSSSAYSFYCEGVNHSDVGVGENYPQYNSANGLMAK